MKEEFLKKYFGETSLTKTKTSNLITALASLQASIVILGTAGCEPDEESQEVLKLLQGEIDKRMPVNLCYRCGSLMNPVVHCSNLDCAAGLRNPDSMCV